VLYITVSQNDEGILGGKHDKLTAADIPNVIVLSAGGYGHVPVPLLKQPTPQCPHSNVAKRKHAFVFAGTVGHAPHHLREDMRDAVETFAAKTKAAVHVGPSRQWQALMCDARFSLCPRGFGRTSYRLAETVGSGRVPVFVYSDQLWVPYRDLFQRFGFGSNVSGLPALLDALGAMGPADIARRERLVEQISTTHFTYAGAMQQISRFMLGQGSDLMCEPLPKSTRDA